MALTLCPFMPGRPAVPGSPRAPYKERPCGDTEPRGGGRGVPHPILCVLCMRWVPPPWGKPHLGAGGAAFARTAGFASFTLWRRTRLVAQPHSVEPPGGGAVPTGREGGVRPSATYIIAVLARGASGAAGAHGSLRDRKGLWGAVGVRSSSLPHCPLPALLGLGVPLPSRHLQRLRARRVHQGGLGNLEGPMVQRGKKGLEKEKDGCEDPNDEFRPTPPPHMGSHHCGLPYTYGEGVLRPALTQPVPTPATKGTHTKGSLGGLGPKTELRRMRRYSQEHQEGRGDHGVLQGPGGGGKRRQS